MSEPWTAFAGSSLYLDTTTLYVFLRGMGTSVHSLFTRIRAADFRAYTSVLTFDELAYRGLLGLIRDHFEGSPLDVLRTHEAEMISRFYPQLAPFLDRLRTFPNLVLVNVSPSDLDVMDEAMRRYQLRPRDSLHLAAMRKCGCLHLVSNDADFDRVPEIHRYTLLQ
jgi:predicted nucleic acid-binding protein